MTRASNIQFDSSTIKLNAKTLSFIFSQVSHYFEKNLVQYHLSQSNQYPAIYFSILVPDIAALSYACSMCYTGSQIPRVARSPKKFAQGDFQHAESKSNHSRHTS